MIKRLALVITLIAVLGLATALVLSACGATGEATSSTTDEQATGGFDGGTITIGAVNSMTGPGAMMGSEQKWAYDKAVADINAAGGVTMNGKKYQIELKYADDQSDASQAGAAMEQLIKVDGLKIILSTETTPVNQAAATVAEKYKAFYMMTVAWADWIEKDKNQWSADYFFTPAIAAAVPFDMVKTMPKSELPKKWGMFTEDNADGQGLAGGVEATAKANGYNYVYTAAATPGSKDYSSSILKLKQAGVDALMAFCSPADAITFVKQMKEANYSPKFFFGWKGFWPTEVKDALGPDVNYLGHDGFWNMDLGYPGAKELGDAFRRRSRRRHLGEHRPRVCRRADARGGHPERQLDRSGRRARRRVGSHLHRYGHGRCGVQRQRHRHHARHRQRVAERGARPDRPAGRGRLSAAGVVRALGRALTTV